MTLTHAITQALNRIEQHAVSASITIRHDAQQNIMVSILTLMGNEALSDRRLVNRNEIETSHIGDEIIRHHVENMTREIIGEILSRKSESDQSAEAGNG